MRDFAKEFRDNPNPSLNWPGATPSKQLAEDFGIFARLMLEAILINKQASAAEVAVSNTALRDRLVAFLDSYKNPTGDNQEGWPVTDVTLKRPRKNDVASDVIRLWELAVALQALLGGIALTVQANQGGGGTPRFPPH
jgi:hypothetical protein